MYDYYNSLYTIAGELINLLSIIKGLAQKNGTNIKKLKSNAALIIIQSADEMIILLLLKNY